MKKFYIATVLVIFSLMIVGCKKKQPVVTEEPVQIQNAHHTWYYFFNNSFKQIDKLVNVPKQPQIPWTEAVRISSANNSFAVVNRLGILSFNEDKINLSTDINLFADRTAGNLVFYNETPIYSVYKSSFFNDTITDANYKKNQSEHLFLIQFDKDANVSYPVLNCQNITDEINSEITDFYWNGSDWFCSIKTITDAKNSFSYAKFHTSASLLDLSPSTAKGKISIDEISVDSFRNAKQFHEYASAPERVKSLLKGFANEKSFTVELKTESGSSPRTFTNTVASCTEKELLAKGIIAPSWSAVLFEDGTLFIEGALPGKHILRNGKPVAVRLPKLPAGFVYFDFVISGTTLYAAWEETEFYKTGRSGFLQVNLDKTLYSKLL